MSRFGLGPWRFLMELARLNTGKAVSFAADRLKQWAWHCLLGYHRAHRADRARREYRLSLQATAHYRNKLLRSVYRQWSLLRRVLRAKAKAVTGHFSRYTLVRRSMKAWKVAYQRSLTNTAYLMHTIGSPHFNRSLTRRVWNMWRRFHEEMQFDREAQQRANSKWTRMQGYLQK